MTQKHPGARAAPIILLQHGAPHIRDPAEAALTAAGHEVHLSSNGIEGLTRLMLLRPDVIITGINMVQMDGFGFIEAVRQLDYLRAIPILMLSASGTAELKTRARNIGAAGWLSVPIAPQTLVQTVRVVAGLDPDDGP